MKKIVIGLVAVVLLAGGAGAFFFLHQPAEASLTEASEEEVEMASKENLPPGEFVELDPLILPIITKKGVTQVVSLVISLEIETGQSAESVKLMKPRLKDAYIQDMYGVLNDKVALRGGVIRVDVIKDRLNKVSGDVLGEEVVRDVLLQVVQQRPI